MARVSCRRQLLAPLVEYFAGTRSGDFSYEVHQTRQSFRSEKGFVAVASGYVPQLVGSPQTSTPIDYAKQRRRHTSVRKRV